MDRADRLRAVVRLPAIPAERVSRAAILRVAIDRGLRELEREYADALDRLGQRGGK
jgi:hypothetical protein